MGMHGEINMWLSYTAFVAHAQRNATRTTNMNRRGRRAREGSEQCTCWLGRDKEQARQRRQQQGPGARASERLRAQASRA